MRDGDEVSLHLQKETGVPRETVLSRKADRSIEKRVTLTARLLAEGTLGADTSLIPGPEAPRNAFVPLKLLQEQLDLDERVNALLVGGARSDLQEHLRGRLTLADWDLTLRPPRRGADYVSLETRRLLLEPAVVEAVGGTKLDAAPTLVYIINNISDAPGRLQVPYSIVAGIDPKAGGAVEKAIRDRVPDLADGEIVLQLHHLGEPHHHDAIGDRTAPLGNGVALWFEVDDFDGAVARGREVGATIETEPHENPNARQMEIWLRDPDGYRVVIAGPSAYRPR